VLLRSSREVCILHCQPDTRRLSSAREKTRPHRSGAPSVASAAQTSNNCSRTFRESASHSQFSYTFRTSHTPKHHDHAHRQRSDHRSRCIASRKRHQAVRALSLASLQVAFFQPADESRASPEAPCRELCPTLRTTTGLAGGSWNARRPSSLALLMLRRLGIGESKKKDRR